LHYELEKNINKPAKIRHMLITNLLLFIASCLVLVLAGTFLVKSLSKIASFLRLSEFVVAFMIMSIATSLPELFVGISSALVKNTAISLGTVIGSNIADIALIGGIITLLARGIKIKTTAIKKDAFHMIYLAIIPLALMIIGNKLSRIDGIILLGIFGYYAWKMYIKERKRFEKEVENNIKRWEIVVYIFVFMISLFFLFFSAEFVVKYGSLLAIDLLLPPIMIGLFLVALGTSLPELVFESRAVQLGHSEMALGDLIGSVIVNSTVVLGVTALIYPITADLILFLTSGFFMFLVTFIFAIFIESGKKLDWKEGVALILLYVFFLIIELNIPQYLKF